MCSSIKIPQILNSGSRAAQFSRVEGVAFNDLRLDIPADVHPELQRLMEDCWKKDPEERPDFDQFRERLKPVAMAFVESEAATGAA